MDHKPQKASRTRRSHLTQRHRVGHSSLHLQNYKSQTASRATQPHESGRAPKQITVTELHPVNTAGRLGAKAAAAYHQSPKSRSDRREDLRHQVAPTAAPLRQIPSPTRRMGPPSSRSPPVFRACVNLAAARA